MDIKFYRRAFSVLDKLQQISFDDYFSTDINSKLNDNLMWLTDGLIDCLGYLYTILDLVDSDNGNNKAKH